MPWISVKDQLPEDCSAVLALVHDFEYQTRYTIVASYDDFHWRLLLPFPITGLLSILRDKGLGYRVNHEKSRVVELLTHWAPLPKLPSRE